MNTRGMRTGGVLVLLVGVGTGARGQEPSSQVMADWQYYNNTGWQAVDRGRLERAAQAFRLAIDTMKPYEATNRGLLARSYADFARVLYLQKRYDEAEPMARWALSVREKSPGDRSEALTQSLDLLAKVQLARGKPADAAPLLKREVEVQQKALGHDHPNQIPAVEALAGIYARQGKVDEAEPLYRRAMSLREQNTEWNLKQAERLEQTAFMMRQIGSAGFGRAAAGVYQANQAERLASQARALRSTSAQSVEMAVTTESYATMLRRAGRVDEADSLDARARALRDAIETRAARERVAP